MHAELMETSGGLLRILQYLDDLWKEWYKWHA